MSPPDAPQPSGVGTVRLLGGVRELAALYDGFVLDLWGVVHDGITAYPGVVTCLERLAAAGKRTVLLSNAPRRAAGVVAGMTRMGIPRACYGAVCSSGEATWQALLLRDDPWMAALGRRCLHIGPARDKAMTDGLDLLRVACAEDADFILNTGVEWDDETVADYEAVMAAGAGRRLPMVCANPDLEVIRGGRRVVCAGLLAARYEELGGEVRYFGKPHPPIYDTCLRELGIANPSRIVAIGDSLRTDIAGAHGAGLEAVLVTGGIHAEELGIVPGATADAAHLAEACRRAGHVPLAALPALVW